MSHLEPRGHRTCRPIIWTVAALALSLLMCVPGFAEKQHERPASPLKHVPVEVRLTAIRKAQIWTSTHVPNMNLRRGPQGRGAFQPNEMVTCDYVVAKLSGASPKFDCAVSEGDVVKVKYGQSGEVEGEVLTTRLLWALGFAADRMYPVRIRCRGCPEDPWKNRHRVNETHVFDLAVIERKLPGRAIETEKARGWAWSELDLVDEQQGGAPVAQRDALKLVAVLVQHTDSKPRQQRLLCLPRGQAAAGGCDKPFMMLNDVGQTFGHANAFNRESTGSVNFDGWSKTPIWNDATACVGHLTKSITGTLENPKISEAGRAFLAGLLVQLTDRQLHDLFEVARVERRSRKPGSAEPSASIDEWVLAFKHKRDEIVNRQCGS